MNRTRCNRLFRFWYKKKINDTSRIDVFDAAVFGTIRMLIDTEKRANASRWFESGKPNT